MLDGSAASAGGFPAMTERAAFLMKDQVPFTASFYLLKQDVVRAALANEPALARNEVRWMRWTFEGAARKGN